MNPAQQQLIERLTILANEARTRGWEDVTSWIGAHLSYTIRDERPRRKRGLRVRLANNMREIVIDADKVKDVEKTQ